MGKRRPKKIIEYDGYNWDSKLELEYYKVFKELGIKVVDRQKQFLLKDKLKYVDMFGKKKTLRDVTYKPDFIIDMGLDKLIAVEVKGYARPLYQLRKKLFMHEFHEKYYFIELKGKYTERRGREMDDGIGLLKRIKELNNGLV